MLFLTFVGVLAGWTALSYEWAGSRRLHQVLMVVSAIPGTQKVYLWGLVGVNKLASKPRHGLYYPEEYAKCAYPKESGNVPMPASRLTLTVLALYVSETPGGISSPVSEVRFLPNYGVAGDTHSGATQLTDDGVAVPNMRQFTAVNPRELGAVAEDLGVPFLDPAWLKANICFAWSGGDNFTQTLVPGTLLLQGDARPVLEIKGEVDPCLKAGQTIAAQFPHLLVVAHQFPKISYGRRGVHGIVLEALTMRIGDTFTAVLPAPALPEDERILSGVGNRTEEASA